MSDRRALTDRLSHVPAHLQEQAGVTVVLCELIDELVEATNRQSALLEQYLTQPASGGNDRPGSAAGAAPATTRQQEEGTGVQLREPGLPPADPDPEPDGPADAGKAPASTAQARRSPAKKAAPPAKSKTSR